MSRYDIVIYGASGFAGSYILQAIATSPLYTGKTVAVSGRSEAKLRTTLDEVATETGLSFVKEYPIIIAHNGDASTLTAMAKQAKVIINAVGPFRTYGEAVVRAAVENGASHVVISGEPSYLEDMVSQFGEKARDNGVYIVGACGFDSIPSDLGTDFLKRNFDGSLAYVETFIKQNSGPSGYALNTGTYQSIILGASSIFGETFRKGRMRRVIMPKELPKNKYTPPSRFPLWKVREKSLSAWSLIFPCGDKSIVERSQYYDYHENGKHPIDISTYFTIGSFLNAVLVSCWLAFFVVFCQFPPTRWLLQAYPECLSFNIFKSAGPTKQQIKEASFEYYIYGRGWKKDEKVDQQKPTKTGAVVCRGRDPGYIGTSACVVSAALAILDDKDTLPKQGGVYTTASAFRDTRIYEYLKTHGVTFAVIDNGNTEKINSNFCAKGRINPADFP